MHSPTIQQLFEHSQKGSPDGDSSLPEGFSPAEELTSIARSGGITPAVVDRPCKGTGSSFERMLEMMLRGLHRRHQRHVLITGQRGVGKTTLLQELVRRCAVGEARFLRSSRFIRFSCQDTSPEESRERLSLILNSVRNEKKAILCLDDLGKLLRADHGKTNTHLFRAALRDTKFQIVGILSQWDFDELLAGESEVLELCTQVQVPEPDEAFALAIVKDAARWLEREHNVVIDLRAVERAVTLSAKFIWNRCQPSKAIGILDRVCEDAEYDRVAATDRIMPSGTDNTEPDGPLSKPASIGVDQVIRVISEMSRVPIETLSGDVDDTDYEQILGAAVVGRIAAYSSRNHRPDQTSVGHAVLRAEWRRQDRTCQETCRNLLGLQAPASLYNGKLHRVAQRFGNHRRSGRLCRARPGRQVD
jgi:AAA lid domain/AAA domain